MFAIAEPMPACLAYYTQPALQLSQQQIVSIQQSFMEHYFASHVYPQLFSEAMPSKRTPKTFDDRLNHLPWIGRPTPGQSIQADQELGLPPKPRCCNHAIWVGNLPSGIDVCSLKELFSEGARDEIESVRLISRTHCAFVNYSTLEACRAASRRFNGSVYYGNVLVCRVRIRDLRTDSRARPSSPASSLVSLTANNSSPISMSASLTLAESESSHGQDGAVKVITTAKTATRFFIIKSLTLQDVYNSVKQGQWITQAHNTEVLDQAFKSTESVYLFFSVNRSGQFCGFAKMTSGVLSMDAEPPTKTSFSKDPLSLSGPADHASSRFGPTIRTTLTPATANAPRGSVIEDPAHDVVFWEAELDATTRTRQAGSDTATPSLVIVSSHMRGNGSLKGGSPISARNSMELGQAGTAFKLQWISLIPLPFHMTRGLKNAWNMDRDVKVARDGTEVDPETGIQLLRLFQESC